jgi:sulfur carrier protein
VNVVVNGSPRQIPDNVTVTELVAHLGLAGGPVAVEINREIVPRADHATRRVSNGDAIEIVHFVGGG